MTEEIKELIDQAPLDKLKSKRLRKFFLRETGINYGGCLCGQDERNLLVANIKKYYDEQG